MEICISSWSLRDHVGREFPLRDFGRVVSERYGIRAVELCQMHFVTYDFGFAFPALESQFLDAIRARATADRIAIVNVPVDVGNVSQVDPSGRAFDLRIVRSWMEAAKRIGSRAVRVNTESVIARAESARAPVDLEVARESFRDLASYAEEVDIELLLENHGGLSSDPERIVAIAQAAQSDRFGICADLGNFPDAIRVASLQRLVPYTRLVHAKTYDFDRHGDMLQYDVRSCLRLFKDAGYDGYVSVEFEGTGDQWDGVARTIELIEKSWR
jgi:sugar phosphate isomerase/epimerase